MVAIKSFLIGAFASVALAGEGIHLVNCGTWTQPDGYHYSIVLYCPDDGDCDKNPRQGDWCNKWSEWPLYPWPNNGQPDSCTFSSGVTFHWSMAANAGDYSAFPYYSPVGDGWNNYRSYKIYKDDHRIMYYDGAGQPCFSEYYAV